MASESFSKQGKYLFKIWVAVVFVAATLLMFTGRAFAYSVDADGVPEWLAQIIERSISAVAERMPESQSDENAEKVIEVISGKLFDGYKVDSVSIASSGEIKISLSAEKTPGKWKVEVQTPQVQDPPLEWLKADIAVIEKPLNDLIHGLPVEALNWCDTGLKEEVLKIMTPILPGWKPTLMVHSEKEEFIMKVALTPELPLVLAVNPTLTSNSLPTLLHEDLREDLMERSSPFIGLPVIWAQRHEKEINVWTENFLQTRGIVERTSAESKASFSAGQVSQMKVNVESRHYTIAAWAALYAGTQDKTGEIGVHLGRKLKTFSRWNVEIYGEGILELQDWDPEGRLGLKWSPLGDVWVGGEWSTRDSMWWGRINIEPRMHKPYAWFRWREDGEYNAAIGYKVTEYVSFELHYDSRDEDSLGLRMLGNL
ncbi:MAG: hypothetical protein GX672_07835 [Synergistaceae bacterium]|nr:hypothetical protein [Synergistaceae bacterium]